MSGRRYSHIFLDLLGTLICPTLPIHLQYSQIAKEAGIDLAIHEASFKKAFKRINQAYPNYGRLRDTVCAKKMNPQEWWALVIKETCEESLKGQKQSFAIDHHSFEKLTNLIIERFSNEGVYSLYPDTLEFISYLICQQQPFSIITNADPRILNASPQPLKSMFINPFCADFQKLPSSEIVHPRVKVFTSWDIGFSKPESEVWDRVISQLNLSKDELMLHVGDDFTEDYLGAKAAGIDSIWLDRSGSQRSEKADGDGAGMRRKRDAKTQTINSLLELIQQIE
ncbi:hypothetical protein O181_043073 [Austropuccinia psidii MF-1]|uniref:Haloacid dehalogenase-like hydrolase domain-containing protein 3 n=1 Tax=Austropuccinia psidii MF-1 TaxID=1389203 RepID=A0A9Q3DKL3_9BASI|nr:hypothetical protein [Austropuccinia psidii MF-1]